MLASVSICVLILVVSQASFWRASSEEGGRTCSSLCTVLTRCTALAACSDLACRSERGVWPAIRTTPLKLVTPMCEEIGRASGRERVGQTVSFWVVAVSLQTKDRTVNDR